LTGAGNRQSISSRWWPKGARNGCLSRPIDDWRSERVKVFLEWITLGLGRWLLRPVLRLSLRYVDIEDPWEPTDRPVRFWAMGAVR